MVKKTRIFWLSFYALIKIKKYYLRKISRNADKKKEFLKLDNIELTMLKNKQNKNIYLIYFELKNKKTILK